MPTLGYSTVVPGLAKLKGAQGTLRIALFPRVHCAAPLFELLSLNFVN